MFTVADSELYTLSSGCAGHAIEASDLQLAVETLRKAGAQFRNKIVTGVGGKQLLAEDPSGNPVELFEPIVPESSKVECKHAEVLCSVPGAESGFSNHHVQAQVLLASPDSILVAFARPQQLSARLAAMMLAMGAVAEGYPSPGWAAALGHLPAVLAMPICLASISCLLAAVIWLPFCVSFPRPELWQRRHWVLVLLPVVFFGLPMVASARAMIYASSALAKPWPLVFSAGPVRVIQDIAGVTPLLFLNVGPFFGPLMQARLFELWLALAILYFSAGFLHAVGKLSPPGRSASQTASGRTLSCFRALRVYRSPQCLHAKLE